ncbi:DUF1493 family protein [Azoarcus sp. TTM-91]|nr:DUF1493 family protein [Azoarcus sp. TTM-91]
MVNTEDAIWPRLLKLIEEIPTVGVSSLIGSKSLERTTDLVSDLGLTGDDAFAFMERYAEEFGVDRGDYDSSNYFEPESLWIFPRLRKRKPKLPITLGMLESAARDGVWNTERLRFLSLVRSAD